MKYLLLFIFICYSADSIEFGERQNKGIIQYKELDENSGMVVGIENKQIIWAINDGSSNEIYGFDKNGKSVSVLHFKKKLLSDDSDVEDIAICKIDDISYIILGDIGDNSQNRKSCFLYFIPEPKNDEIMSEVEINSSDILTIELTYEDGPRDAECLLVDPRTNNIFIVTKREKNARLYELTYPYSNNEKRILIFKQNLEIGNNVDLGFTSVTGGDISKDGENILIRDYSNVFYFHREINQDITDALTSPLNRVGTYNYSMLDEPQGEAICWENNNEGFFTASEEKGFSGYDASLFYFNAIVSSVKKKDNKVIVSNNIITNLYSKIIKLKFYNYLGQNLLEIDLPPYCKYHIDRNKIKAHYLWIENEKEFYNLGFSDR